MHFSDGNWLLPDDMDLAHPVHVRSVTREGNRVKLIVLSKRERNRGDQLNTLVFTVWLSAPAEGLISVRTEHHFGSFDAGPHFALARDPDFCPAIEITDEFVRMTSGALSVRVERAGDFRLDFHRDGRFLTASEPKAAGYAVHHPRDTPHVFERLNLGVGDCVYGLGERFGPFVRNGQRVEIWNRDGGTSTDQAYKNIPFFLTNRGWGVFVNEPGRVEFEVATEKVSKVQFSSAREGLEYIVIDGPTPKDALERYTALTGRPPLPPAWSFGLWLTTSFTTNYDEATVLSFVDGMAERRIPLHVFHFDCFWMRGLNWCDFEWDPDVFPDPEALLAKLHRRGLKVCVWINPYIAQQSGLFEEGRTKGYFLKRPDGRVWQWDLWQAGMAIVDFTNPEACVWYAGHLKRLMRMGVDCFKTDFGERIPTDVVYCSGADPERMHNFYPQIYNRTVYKAIEEARGEGEAVLFARSATAGGQTMPVHWGGDSYSTFESMAETLRGGLSLGLSGFAFWSHDISGFERTASPPVYKRWCAFGLMSSHSRLHGSESYRVPWLFDDEAVDVLRFFTELKHRLMPYLYGAAIEARDHGWPVLRAMLIEHPHDQGAETLDRQYMLGGALLVAPVFRDDGEVTFYLPKGRWTRLLTNEEVAGDGWRVETHDYFSLPLYVRPNTILPFGGVADRPDYDYVGDAVYRVYALDDGGSARCAVVTRDGATAGRVSATRAGDRLSLGLERIDRATFLLVGVNSARAVGAGASVSPTPQGALIEVEGGAEIAML